MVAERLYRWSLRAFPRSFREQYGRDMEELFSDRLSGVDGSVARVVVTVRGLADVMVHAMSERRAQRVVSRTTGPGSPRQRAGGAWRWIGALVNDTRQSIRALGRSPGFTLVVIATVALGTGATTAVFSVVNALLLRGLPYAQPDRLVAVWPSKATNKTAVHRIAEAVPAFASVSGVSIWGVTVAGDGADPEQVDVALVSTNHFETLGAKPALGRTFREDEGRIGADGVIILSDEYWHRRFGGDAGVIGATLRMSGAGHLERTVIGVMPAGFRPIVPQDLAGWVPLEDSTGVTFATDPTWYVNWRVARLAPGATVAQAVTQLQSLATTLHEESAQFLDDQTLRTLGVEPLRENRIGDTGRTLWLLLGAVMLVLLIACANVANLLLARGESRLREISVRRAIGARGGRIAGQLLGESAVLALAGGGLGTGLAFGLLGLIVSRAPDLPDAASISVDSTVLAFALALSLLCSLLFGLAPVLRARGATAANALRHGARGSIGASRHGIVSHVLVGAEIGLSVVLVVGAGLMLRTLGRMYAVDPGFEAGGVLAFRVDPPSFRYDNAVAIRSFYSSLRDRLSALPGVESVAGIQLLPVTRGNWSFPVSIEGRPVPEGQTPPAVNFRVTTPGYFATMRIPVLAGRTIEQADADGALRVAVINQSMEKRFFPGEEAIGRTLRVFGTGYTIVGVVGDVHQRSLNSEPRPEMYVAHEQIAWDVGLWLVVRARTGDPMALAPLVRQAVRATDADAPVSGLATMSSVVDDSASTTSSITLLLGSFGFLALLLGAIGVYGVTAYTTARRLPEFGVRLALGASRGDVLAAATKKALLPVFVGIAAGVTTAFEASRFLQSLLFDVPAHDPLTFASAPLILGLVSLVAALVPAIRASRIDPVQVMRSE